MYTQGKCIIQGVWMNSFGFVQGFIYRYISYQVPHLMSQIVQGC